MEKLSLAEIQRVTTEMVRSSEQIRIDHEHREQEVRDIADYEHEISICGNPDLVDREMARFYPQSTSVKDYEDWYFDRDPDRCEREAERWDWRQNNISPNSVAFDYDYRCSWCQGHHMHNADQHNLRIRLYEAKQQRELAMCDYDEHPF